MGGNGRGGRGGLHKQLVEGGGDGGVGLLPVSGRRQANDSVILRGLTCYLGFTGCTVTNLSCT